LDFTIPKNGTMLNRLEMLRIFSVVAESSSFKDAATRMATSPQKITRIIKELERITGEVLFHRNTRSIQITEFGEAFHLKIKNLITEVDDLFIDQGPVIDDLSGKVRITVSKTLAQRHLMTIMKPLLKKYPEIVLDIRATDVLSDLVEEKIDIGIRGGHSLKDAGLIARPVAKLDFKIVGTPELIKRVGKPLSIDDLHLLPCTHLVNHSTGKPWHWNLNEEDFIPANPSFVTNDTEVELNAVLSGLGFSQLGTSIISPYLKSGKLIEVMKDHSTESWTLYVFRPQRSPVPRRVRLVFDHLVSSLSNPKIFPVS
jgi:DNA-binding transcriptional LysR family regulator